MRDNKTYYSVTITHHPTTDGWWSWAVHRDSATEYARGSVDRGASRSEDEAKADAREAAVKHVKADAERKAKADAEAATRYSYTIAV